MPSFFVIRNQNICAFEGMMTPKEWRSLNSEQRLSHQLKLQSHQIEQTFSQHAVETEVVGGNVSHQAIRFDLSEQLELGKEMLSGIKDDLLAMFGVSSMQFLRDGGGLRLQVERQQDVPVPLLELISSMDEIGVGTAVLGLDDENNPLLHDFSPDSLSHILVQGDEGAGKSAFLRTVGVSLAMLNKQSQLQLIAIAPDQSKQSPLTVFNYLPHMLEPVVTAADDCQLIFDFLEEEMQYRLSQKMVTPTIVILIDDFELLLDNPQIVRQTLNLLQNGSDAGIHLVIGHREVAAKPMPELLKANIPFNIVGNVAAESDARHVTGIVDSAAHELLGAGDFVTIIGDTKFYFQAAYIGDYELHLIIDKLHRSRPRSILAQTAVSPPETTLKAEPLPRSFTITDSTVEIAEAADDANGIVIEQIQEPMEAPVSPVKKQFTPTIYRMPTPIVELKEEIAEKPTKRYAVRSEEKPEASKVKPSKPKKPSEPKTAVVKRFVKRSPKRTLKRVEKESEKAAEPAPSEPATVEQPTGYFEQFESEQQDDLLTTTKPDDPIPFDLGLPPD